MTNGHSRWNDKSVVTFQVVALALASIVVSLCGLLVGLIHWQINEIKSDIKTVVAAQIAHEREPHHVITGTKIDELARTLNGYGKRISALEGLQRK